MEQMMTVLGRLSEIEAAAVNIENEAANEKRRIAREYEQKTIDFDQKLDAQTEEKLKELNEKLKAEAEQELLKMREETQQELDSMKREYDQNHKKLVDKLFHYIIGE